MDAGANERMEVAVLLYKAAGCGLRAVGCEIWNSVRGWGTCESVD